MCVGARSRGFTRRWREICYIGRCVNGERKRRGMAEENGKEGVSRVAERRMDRVAGWWDCINPMPGSSYS